MIEIGNRKKPKILIVDDEEQVIESLSDLLRKDFHIFATCDVNEAQELLGSSIFFSVVISDQRMPVLTGAELLARALEISPDTARILLTGYADIGAVIQAVNQGQILQYVIKPWDGEKLLEMLRPIAESHFLKQQNRQLMEELNRLNRTLDDSEERIDQLESIESSVYHENQILTEAYHLLDNSYWHLRKIQEVLPICMECGKVKTSDSSWEDVVNYLKKNTNFLSHGYCPECYEKFKSQNKELFQKEDKG
jgi:response regulator RpfG family c-di-GMP phosphodiesterase